MTLDHISLSINYQPGMAHVFGPPSQQLCRLCPMALEGGSALSVPLLTITGPSNYSQIEYWLNLTSPIPVAFGCSPLSPPSANGTVNPACSYSMSIHSTPTTLTSGQGNAYTLDLAVPSPAPVLIAGSEIDVTLVVHTG